eukprot:6182094-Pleurochrysis_carterae.AAC.2
MDRDTTVILEESRIQVPYCSVCSPRVGAQLGDAAAAARLLAAVHAGNDCMLMQALHCPPPNPDTGSRGACVHLHTSQRIPRRIMQTGPDFGVSSAKHGALMSAWWDLNPEYAYTYMNDTQAYQFVRQHCSKQEVVAFKSVRQGAQRSDLFRLLYLRAKGGIYADLDQELRLPLREWIPSNVPAVSSIEWPFELLAYEPGHPIIALTAKKAVANVLRQLHLHFKNSSERCQTPITCIADLTGPGVYKEAIRNQSRAAGCGISAGHPIDRIFRSFDVRRDCTDAKPFMRDILMCDMHEDWLCNATRHIDCRWYEGTERLSKRKCGAGFCKCGPTHWQHKRSQHNFFLLTNEERDAAWDE